MGGGFWFRRRQVSIIATEFGGFAPAASPDARAARGGADRQGRGRAVATPLMAPAIIKYLSSRASVGRSGVLIPNGGRR